MAQVNGIKENVYINEATRSIWLHDDVCKETMSKVAVYLKSFIDNDDKQEQSVIGFTRQPIHFYINTYGGYVDDLFTVLDIMLNTKTPIYTYCSSYAMSCGFYLFIAGSKRFVGQFARLMYHQLSAGNYGTYQDMKEYQEELDITQSTLEQLAIERTQIPQARLDSIRERKVNWYIRQDEAIELGIATDKMYDEIPKQELTSEL